LRVTTFVDFGLDLRCIIIIIIHRQTTTDDGDVDVDGRTRILAGKSTRHL
jgi:hypothetical protein